jgi:hypothetical protein
MGIFTLNPMTDQARQYILDLFTIVGTDSILIINGAGEVKRLKCPFIVVCKIPTSNLVFGNPYSVSAVKMTLRLEDVFIINGRAYFIWYFAIVE